MSVDQSGAVEIIRDHLELALIRAGRHWTELEEAIADILDRLDGWCLPQRKLMLPNPNGVRCFPGCPHTADEPNCSRQP